MKGKKWLIDYSLWHVATSNKYLHVLLKKVMDNNRTNYDHCKNHKCVRTQKKNHHD
jgi:hypothetical protein